MSRPRSRSRSRSSKKPSRDTRVHRSRSAAKKARKENKWPSICFLSNSNEYFVCKGKRASRSCSLLRSVQKRALQNGHKSVAKKAAMLLKTGVCK